MHRADERRCAYQRSSPARHQIAELAQTKNFGYDNVDRLTSMTNGTANENYAFDGVGNRTTSQRSATYAYQPFNKLTATQNSTYGYDANGNMTSRSGAAGNFSFTWDYENRLVGARSGRFNWAKYKYDANGNMLSKSDATGYWIYGWNYEDRMMMARKDNKMVWQPNLVCQSTFSKHRSL